MPAGDAELAFDGAGERLPLRLDTCDLGAIAREVVQELTEVHGQRFTPRIEEGVRGVWGADDLRRALWNLATNAQKYGAPDEPITLTVQRLPEGARASVHNFGPAISPEDQKHLFEPFFRASSMQAQGPRGWGLGLSLVQACAQAHGGN